MNQSSQFRFSPFHLDTGEERLYRGDVTVTLRPKSFAVLRYLLEHPGQLVTKNELLDRVWPDTVVSDAVLKVCIQEVRNALGDEASRPQFIETAHRRGYRFVARVTTTGNANADQSLIASSSVVKFDLGSASTPDDAHPHATRANTVGREADIARLRQWFDESLQGERRVVFVTGEPGMGKTTLVEAFLATIAGESLVARGQCLDQYGASEAYLPVLEAFSRLSHRHDRDQLVTLLKRHAPSWLVQMPSLTDYEERENLQREIAGQTSERMLREMGDLVEALTAAAPLVLVLEDLHWSDYSTLDLVSALARRSEPARLLVIGTYRPVEVILSGHPLKTVKQELQMHRRCEELALEYLPEPSIAEYLTRKFPHHDFPQTLAAFVHQRTEGNPLFVVNLIDYLLASGWIAARGRSWELRAELAEIENVMPENIRSLIERQIDRLEDGDRRALEAASVAGVEFSTLAVAAALDENEYEIEERCQALARRQQFLRAEGMRELPGGAVTESFSFIHALYQNTLYGSLAKSRRSRYHTRIAERLEASYGERAHTIATELAIHFEEGRDAARAVKYFQAAAETASFRAANPEVIALADRALTLLETQPDSPDRMRRELTLHTLMAAPLIATRGYGAPEVQQAHARARELCEQLGDDIQSFPMLWGLARFYLVQAPLGVARDLGVNLLRLAERAQDSDLLVEAHDSLGATLLHLGEFGAAQKHLEQAIAVYDPEKHGPHVFIYGQDPAVVCLIYAALNTWFLGYPDRAVEYSRRAIAHARDLAHPYSLILGLKFAAVLHQLRREAAWVKELAEESIRISDEHGFTYCAMHGILLRAWALAEEGRGPEAIEETLECLNATHEAESKPLQSYGLAVLAHAHLKMKQPHEALAALDESIAVTRITGERFYEAELHRIRGEILLLLQSRGEQRQRRPRPPATSDDSLDVGQSALDCFRQAISVARGQAAKSWELRASLSLARCLGANEEAKDARRALGQVYDWFSEGLDTADLQDARVILAE